MEELDLNADDSAYLFDHVASDDKASGSQHQNVSGMTKLYAFIILSFQSTFKISDSAVTALLILLISFLRIVFKKYHSEELLLLCNELPCSVLSARKILGNDTFKRFACCPSCFTLYPWPNKNLSTNSTCSYVQYPDHPQRQHRKPCGSQLVKSIKTSNGGNIDYPLLNYCYKPVIESLQRLMLRSSFISNCEEWRSRPVDSGLYQDIYDGKLWSDFLRPTEKPFLSLPFNLALSINVDWFQPFERTQHSEGAIYISILNLPRQYRYLHENIILLGIIPGPKEPKQMNSLLKPFVDELLKLWDGVIMKTHDGLSAIVRAALICCACDIPAARKVCGFVGHSGTKGCSRCLLSFTKDRFGAKSDYTDTNRDQWPLRTLAEHKIASNSHKDAKCRSEQKLIEKHSGVKYSVLNDLPYFDAPRMCIVDPMHNLLLGTSKNIMELWKSNEVLSENDFEIIQQRVDSFVAPNDIGRMPSKIASGFSGFTAEQWKNWTIFFSLYALNGVLPQTHYHCWLLYVKACFILCRQRISDALLKEADTHLMNFYKEVVRLYGNTACNINLHLHTHLYDYMQDYGPVYSFWLFPFERLNGVLGSYTTNGRNISIQLMQRFLQSSMLSPCNWPEEYQDDFIPFLQKFKYNKGSLKQTVNNTTEITVTHLLPLEEHAFDSSTVTTLQRITSIQYPDDHYSISVLHQKCKAIKFNNFTLGSVHSRYHKTSVLLVTSVLNSTETVLCETQYFLKCQVVKHTNTGPSTKIIWFAAIQLLMEHPCKVWFGSPVQVWGTTPQTFDITFIPITSIEHRVVYAKTKFNFGRLVGDDSVYIIVPIENNNIF